MRKFKGALISILALLVLAGICFIIANLGDSDNKPATPDDTGNFGDVLTLNYEDIVYYGMVNSYGAYSFELKDGLWYCVEDSSVELDRDVVFSKIVSASYYDAYTISEGEYNPSDYGLDNPSMTVTLRLETGEEHIVTFGDIAPTDDHLYYISIDDIPAVYAALGAKYDILNVPLGSFRESDFFTLDYNGIKKITIGGKNKETIVIEENTAQNEMSMSNWLMTSPYNKSVNEFTLSDLIIAPLSEESIKIQSYAEDKPSSLSKYGLGNPENYITFTYADRAVTLKFGGYDDSGNVYAMKSGSDTVYTVSANRLSFFEYTAFEYVDKSVYFAIITELSALNVRSGDETYEITIPSDGGNYKINGKKTTEEKVKAFYSELASLAISGVLAEPVEGAAEITVNYEYIDAPAAKLEFIPYTARNYAVKINGSKADFYVKKADVSKLISIIAEL